MPSMLDGRTGLYDPFVILRNGGAAACSSHLHMLLLWQ